MPGLHGSFLYVEGSHILPVLLCCPFAKINEVHWFWQIMCRCSTPLDTAVKEKISMFCHVEPTQVWYIFIF